MLAPALNADRTSREAPRARQVALRYGLSAFGPAAIAAAHFIASLIFLRTATPADFGLFSFVLVIVPLFMSMSSALLGAPVAVALNRSVAADAAEMATYLKSNLVFSGAAGIGVFLLLLASRAAPATAAVFGLYGAAMTLRWFARSFAYAEHRQVPAIVSDAIYSALVVAGLAALLLLHALTMLTASVTLLAAAVVSVTAFGPGYFMRQFRLGPSGSLRAYVPVWLELTRWSLAGVVLSELTGNAHAYFVTFISGPKVFALLAVGSLMMRPISLVLSALPDMERPVMARKIAQGDLKGAFRTVNEFRTAAGAVWLATMVLAAALLTWFPHLLIKPGYDATKVVEVVIFWIAISAVRALRTPDAVFLQAAREFNPLARAGARSSVVSLIATPALLIVFGPVASLGGILLGDIVMTANIFTLTRGWKQRHA
jgi:O-antigen/teichoic acid export membrane protein